VIVNNTIVGDSRVQKTALAAARDGWDVTLIGITLGRREEHGRLGPVKLLRVRVPERIPAQVQPAKARPAGRSLVSPFGLPGKGTVQDYQWAHRLWVRERSLRLGFLSGPDAPGGLRTQAIRAADKALLRGGNAVYKARMKALQRLIPREEAEPAAPAPGDAAPIAFDLRTDWRPILPDMQNLDLAIGDAIERLRPDVIHANDFNTIHIGARSAARLRARGHHCVWLYDAHEYTRGVHKPDPRQHAAYVALEAEYIRYADAVVTVNPEISELLRRDHRLAEPPLPVSNTPVRGAVTRSPLAPSIREDCGLDAETPLFAHVGSVAEKRDLPTAFAALQLLPEAHLAVVAALSARTSKHYRTMAARMGIRDRVHFLPYVPQHQVPDYVSSADLGLFCGLHTVNHDLALATKLFEYLHGGLPVVTSDVRAMSAFVREHGVGQVFTAGDAESLAQAIRAALDQREQHVANITDELLDTHSWEQQSGALMRLYRKLSGLQPEAPAKFEDWNAECEFGELPDAASAPAATAPSATAGRSLAEAAIRVGIGPANSAGQGDALARALRRERPEIAAQSSMLVRSASLAYPADVKLDAGRQGDLDYQTRELRRVLGSYTHLVADGFQPVFGLLNGDHIGADLPALARAGIKVALLGHGSEIRRPQPHLDRHEHSMFQQAPADVLERLTALSARNHDTALRAYEDGLPVFVTTPDLLHDLPFATWIPVIVDLDAWSCDAPVLERDRPIVLHAPSRRWTKGTDVALPALQRLHDEGAIELRLVEGADPARMPEYVREADIVADQFVMGSYGTFACEAMAASKPVICYHTDLVAETVGEKPPLVNATPATVREAVESLLDDRRAGAELGRRGREFVERHHDGRRSVQVLSAFLDGTSAAPASGRATATVPSPTRGADAAAAAGTTAGVPAPAGAADSSSEQVAR